MEFMDQDGEEDGDGEVVAAQFCVVGRVVTDKPLNFIAFRQTMAAVWRPVGE